MSQAMIPTKNTVTIATRQVRMRVKQLLSKERMDMTELTLIVTLIKKSMANQHITVLNGVKLLQKIIEKLNYFTHTLVLRSRLFVKKVKKQLDQISIIILEYIVSKDWPDARACLDASMKLLKYETSLLIAIGEEEEFNMKRFTLIVNAMLSRTIKRPPVLIVFQSYCRNLDIVENVWELLDSYIKPSNFSNEIFKWNFMALVRSCKLNMETLLSDRYYQISSKKFDYGLTSKSILNVWESLLEYCNLETISSDSLRHLLFGLKEAFLVHLPSNPNPTTEFLMNSLTHGEQTSRTALENIYLLIRTKKISIEIIYETLGGLFDAQNFLLSKHKARILYMADLFLSSDEIPLSIVTSIVERLGRLTRIVAQNDRIMILTLIQILSKRFSSHELLLETPMNNDQANMVEPGPSPILTMAFITSIWEEPKYPVTATVAEVKASASEVFHNLPIQHERFCSVLQKDDAKVFDYIVRRNIRALSSCYRLSSGFRLRELERANFAEYLEISKYILESPT